MVKNLVDMGVIIVLMKGWEIGLLEGEEGNEKRVKIRITRRWKEHWGKVEYWAHWRVKCSMKKEWKFGLLKGERSAKERVKMWLTGGWQGQWRKGEIWIYLKEEKIRKSYLKVRGVSQNGLQFEKRGGTGIRTHDERDARRRRYRLRYRDRQSYFIFLVRCI